MSTLQTREHAPQIIRHTGPVATPVGMPSGPPVAAMTGRDVWRIIRKRIWLIILPVVFFSALAVGGTFMWRRHVPLYTASAYLRVVPERGEVFGRAIDPRADVVERHVLAQAEMVDDEIILSAALDKLLEDKAQGKEFKWLDTYSERPDQLEELKDILSVTPVPNTDLIRISIEGRVPDEVTAMATAIARAHVADVRKTTETADERRINLLGQQLEAKQGQLTENRNQQRRATRQSESPADLAAKGGTLRARLEAYGRQLTMAGLEVTQARGTFEALKKQQDSGELANSPEVTAAVELDPRLHNLRQQRDGLKVLITAKEEKLGPLHPDVKALNARLATIDAQIQKRMTEVQDYQMSALVTRAQSGLDSLIAQQLQLKEQFDDVEKRVQEIDAIFIVLGQLETSEKQLTDEVERIERRIMELSLARAARVPVELGRAAETPKEPSFPLYIMMVPIGVALGLLLGLGLAFLVELVDTSVKSPADIHQRTNLAVLGTVPHTRDLDEDVDDIRRAFIDNRGSMVGEAFRHIRTCLQFSGPAEHRRSILVTSPLPDDGRTTVTMNLAASIARSGRKVLVIDTNFRQPAASRLFIANGATAPGLSNVLVGQSAWADVVHEIEANLHVMPTGPMPPNPAELLGSDPMRQLQTELFEEYDQVLLDGAPCLVVTDPAILSTVVDGVVLVVRAGSNTYGMVQRAGQNLERIGVRMLGTVVNGVRVTVGGYLQENYDRFYDYQEQAELPLG